ncbi:MAG: ABC transporter substrate-binding protein [Myxococcales bacterium]|nr:ABC transporter substrate-binding protein [Myxococcales bacterium]
MRIATLGLCLALLFPAVSERPAAAAKDTAFKKPIKVLIGGVRYGKNALAMKMLDLEAMAATMCGSHWSKMSAGQKAEFQKGIGIIIRKSSFKKARDVFKHIDAVLYGKPAVSGEQARIKTTIVIHRAYKKKELVVNWVLKKTGKRYRILDIEMAGESTLKGIHDEEVQPLIKKGGTSLLLKKLKGKVSSL